MRKHIVLIAAAICLLAAPAVAAGNGNAAAGKSSLAAQQQTLGNAIICKSLPPPTGTRLGGRRICMTRADWDQEHHDASDAVMREQTLGKMGRLPFKQ